MDRDGAGVSRWTWQGLISHFACMRGFKGGVGCLDPVQEFVGAVLQTPRHGKVLKREWCTLSCFVHCISKYKVGF